MGDRSLIIVLIFHVRVHASVLSPFPFSGVNVLIDPDSYGQSSKMFHWSDRRPGKGS